MAGAPCRNPGHHKPVGARQVYCGRHRGKWPRFESVRFEEVKPKLSDLEGEERWSWDVFLDGFGELCLGFLGFFLMVKVIR